MARKPKKSLPAEKRAPKEREVAAIEAARASRLSRPTRAQVSSERKPSGALHMESPHSDSDGGAVMVQEAFASSSSDFAIAGLQYVANSTRPYGGDVTAETVNSGLALMGAIAPQNELEAALAMQMVATHELSMLMLIRARQAGAVAPMKEYGNLATKLNRTFATQMKTLADWRRGGEQVVRHVHVYEGGQAMVAETILIGGQNVKTAEPPHALSPAMLGYDETGNGVPIASDPWQEAVPHARGQKPRGSRQQA